jgi:hypothetical protein
MPEAKITAPTAEVLADMGAGLLGFSQRPLSDDVYRYYEAMGLTKENVRQVAEELRQGISPLTRPPRR